MTQYQYHLALSAEQRKYNGSKYKWVCPQCGQREFVCYLDSDGNIIDKTVGKCERIYSCGYHYTPSQYFKDNAWTQGKPLPPRKKAAPKYIPPVPISYIPKDIVIKSMQHYNLNTFVQCLYQRYPHELVDSTIAKYYVGTSKWRGGSAVFWQIDTTNHVRAGKVMRYDNTMHRVKEGENDHPTWVHTLLHLDNFNQKQCLFGEHLLKDSPDDLVVIVESEKTAIILAIEQEIHPLYDHQLYLAAGNSGGLNVEKCQCLRCREVTLAPDQGQFANWGRIGAQMTYCDNVFITDVMEQLYSQGMCKEGADLADVYGSELEKHNLLIYERMIPILYPDNGKKIITWKF